MSKNYVLALVKDIDKLSVRSEEINVAENAAQVINIVNKLKDTIKAHKDLMALAAPQLGYQYRIICIRFADDRIETFINPMITKIEGKSLNIEQINCLPDKDFMVQRSERVMVGYQRASGQYNELSLKYPLSALLEQMIDLLDGTLFFKYNYLGLPIDKDYYKASKEEKDELHKWYLETFIPERVKALQEIADNDKEITAFQNQIKYFKSIIEGDTEVAPVYEDEVDLENTSLKVVEANDKFRKEYLDSLKKNLGVEDGHSDRV